ncbi:hypothetical protein ACFQU3_06735 [Terrabacter sp. GCM10028922]
MEAQLAGTRWQLGELGRSVAAAADAYDTVEQTVRESMTGARRGGGGGGR